MPGKDVCCQASQLPNPLPDYQEKCLRIYDAYRYAENAFNVRGGCGFSFGNGCSDGVSSPSLFGAEKKRTIPIKAEI